MEELYKRFRPKSFKDIIGQDSAVEVLSNYVKRKSTPHFLLFSGPTGCGKTTLARIMANKLGCGDNDLTEVNCASLKKPLNAVQDIQMHMGMKAVAGPCRVWILDEVQALSRTRFAQQALLKILEDTAEGAYFMLATTDPDKLIKAIRNRATVIPVKFLSIKDMQTLLRSISKKAEIDLSEELEEAIIDAAEGSPRQALVMLDSIIGLDESDKQIDAIQKASINHQGIMIARTMFNPKATWKEMAEILKAVNEEPESLRLMILSYSAKILLGGGKLAPRADLIIQEFSDPFYDAGGKAQLISGCWSIMSPQKGK
jgi:DNA polymerase III gamma/tau subunit